MYVYVCVGDDGKADGSKPTQVLPAGFAHVNQVTFGSPAQSAVSSQIMPSYLASPDQCHITSI